MITLSYLNLPEGIHLKWTEHEGITKIFKANTQEDINESSVSSGVSNVYCINVSEGITEYIDTLPVIDDINSKAYFPGFICGPVQNLNISNNIVNQINLKWDKPEIKIKDDENSISKKYYYKVTNSNEDDISNIIETNYIPRIQEYSVTRFDKTFRVI